MGASVICQYSISSYKKGHERINYTRLLFVFLVSFYAISYFVVSEAEEKNFNRNANALNGVASKIVNQTDNSIDRYANVAEVFKGLSENEIQTRAALLNNSYAQVKRKNKTDTDLFKTPILHIKSPGGLKFTKFAIPDEEITKVKKIITEGAKENVKHLIKDFEKEALKTTTVPLCKDNKVKIIKHLDRHNKNQLVKTKPMLVLQKDLIPQESNLAFGVDVKVLGVEVSSIVGFSEMMRLIGFSCLPIRMHVAKNGLMLIEGQDALKNYDKDEEGKLDKGVERLWHALLVHYRSIERSQIGNQLGNVSK
jgi:hypothetical protein